MNNLPVADLQPYPAYEIEMVVTECDAYWMGLAKEDWCRGTVVIRRQSRCSLVVERIPGEGLLLQDLPEGQEYMISEETWTAFARGDRPSLIAEVDHLRLVFQRSDFPTLLPPEATILPFKRPSHVKADELQLADSARHNA